MSVVLPKFAPDGFAGSWVEDLPSETYHSDKTFVSSTDLKRIQKSPYTFYQAMADHSSEEEDRDPTDALRLGEIFHLAVLEPKKFFARYVKMPEFKGVGMKAAKAEWHQAQAPDSVIVTEKEFLQIEGMVNSVLSHRDACALLKHGSAEISGYYRDPLTGIQCKFRPDFMNFDLMTLIDVKTTRDCSQNAFSRCIWQYRYDIQMAHYMTGVESLTGKQVDFPIFICIEKIPPYECALWVADEVVVHTGQQERARLMQILKECLDSESWPKYQKELQKISLPTWATKESPLAEY